MHDSLPAMAPRLKTYFGGADVLRRRPAPHGKWLNLLSAFGGGFIQRSLNCCTMLSAIADLESEGPNPVFL
jgi:hypothetical protein